MRQGRGVSDCRHDFIVAPADVAQLVVKRDLTEVLLVLGASGLHIDGVIKFCVRRRSDEHAPWQFGESDEWSGSFSKSTPAFCTASLTLVRPRRSSGGYAITPSYTARSIGG